LKRPIAREAGLDKPLDKSGACSASSLINI
jgi:hypothetical protein